MEPFQTLTAGRPLPRVELSITQKMIDRYAEISGDFNPVHVDVARAADGPFGGTIAHGCIPLEPLFQGLGRALRRPDLPFATRIALRYRRPSMPGDRIHLEAEVTGVDGDGAVTIGFACVNQNGEPVLDGECRLPGPEEAAP